MNGTDQLLQLVRLPGGSDTATISFHIYKESEAMDDRLQIRLEDAETRDVITAPATVGAETAPGAWQEVRVDASGLGSRKAVRLVIQYISGSGTLYVDNVQLSYGCR